MTDDKATDDKAADDRLVMDELRLLRQMADTLEAVFWLADAQKPRILYVSPAYDRIWGRDRQRLTAHYHEFFEAIHPDDQERVRAASSRCIAQEQFEAEYRIVRPDGEVRWIRDRGFLIRDQDGAPDRMAGFAEDITQVKQQERDRAALEQERDRFLAVGSDLHMIIGFDHILQWVNPAVERTLGWTAAEIIGQPWFNFTHPDDADGLDPSSNQGITTSGLCQFENRYRHQDGSYRWFLWNIQRYSDEQVVYVVAVDISDRKRREADLAFLAQIAEDSSRLPSEEALMRCIGERLAAHLRLDGFTFATVDEGRESVTIKYSWNAADVPQLVGTFRFADYMTEEFSRTMRAGETWVVCDTQHDDRTNAQATAAIGVRAIINVPYHRQGEWQGCLTAMCREVRQWTADEIALVVEVSNRAFPRLERARAEADLRQSEAKYRSLFENVNDGFCIIEMLYDNGQPINHRFLEANPAFEAQSGLIQAIGKTARDFAPNLEVEVLTNYERVLTTGEPIEFETHIADLDQFFRISAYRHGDPQTKQLALIFNNITDRKLNERRQAFLLQLSDGLRSRVDPTETQIEATRLLGEYLKANRVTYFEIIGDDYVVKRDYVDQVPHLVGRYPVSSFGQNLLSIYQSGIVAICHNVNLDADLDAAEKQAFADIQIGAYLGVPLVKNGQFVAGLAIHSIEPRPWTTSEITLAVETAERTWSAVERARAEEATAADLQDTQLLRQLGARLVTEGNIQTLYQEIMATAIALTHADAGTVQILDDVTQDLLLLATQGLDRTITDHFYRVDVNCNTSCGIALRTGERSITNFDVPESQDPDGSMRMHVEAGYLSAQSTPLITRSGRAIGMVSTHWHDHYRPSDRELRFLDLLARQAADLIEQRQSEQALRQSESRFRLMVESAKDYAIFTLNLNGIVTSWNVGAERLLKYSETEIVGRLGRIIFTPEDNEQGKAEREMYLALTEGQAVNERWHLRQDGSRFWGSGLMMPLQDEAGTTQGFVKILQDKTAERQNAADRDQLLQQEQAARSEADRANRIKDEFLAVLSHELRSPLNPILGWTKLLRQGRLDAPKTEQALNTIERNAKLQAELIEDLLDVSRILRGKLTLNVSPVNLAVVVRSAMDTVRLAADAKAIEIEADMAETASISGDSTRLQQVVWNLLSNAVKFTPAGGRVEVRLEIKKDEERMTNDPTLASDSNSASAPRTLHVAQLSVRDTGKGIAADFLPHVFDYFQQEDGATTRKFGGLGLGLAIVKQIVELHGGTVWAESEGEGQGATFTVRLPLLKTEGRGQTAEGGLDSSFALHPSSLPLNGLQVLVVDDDTDSRDLIAFVVEEAGARVTTATSAAEAIALLMQSQLDVILSDVGMPDMDGYMLMRQVRGFSPEQNGQVKAIALTAYAGDFNQQHALQAGFQRHIAKPVEPDQLVEAIVLLSRAANES